jgi:hypothetical protein
MTSGFSHSELRPGWDFPISAPRLSAHLEKLNESQATVLLFAK